LLLAGKMVIIQSMSRFRIILILLVCMAAAFAGGASAHDGRSSSHQPIQAATETTATLHDVGNQSMLTAVADQQDVDCDNDGCDNGPCKHTCMCGCGMGSCASPCMAFPGQHSVSTRIDATNAIAKLIAQQPVAARGTTPLRPPIV
jgi:hypothetical protein